METFTEFLDLKEGDCIKINSEPLYLLKVKGIGIGRIYNKLEMIGVDCNLKEYLITVESHPEETVTVEAHRKSSWTHAIPSTTPHTTTITSKTKGITTGGVWQSYTPTSNKPI